MQSTYAIKARKKKPPIVRAINSVIKSPTGVFILSLMTAAAHALSLEFYFYLFVIFYAIYVAACADDLSPLMPLFPLCYIAPSQSNNPGISEDSIFWGTRGAVLLALVSVAIIILFVRIAKDSRMGFKRLFTKKRALAPGMLLLGVAYLLSGILADDYSDVAPRNIVFALIQFLSVFLLYFVFTATVNYNKFKISYIASIGICTGFVVLFELVWIYITGDVISDGMILRSQIYTGWGVYNNLGVLIVMAIPFAFYFASRARFAVPFIVFAFVLFAGAFLSCSRSAMLFSVPIFIISIIAAVNYSKHRVSFVISSVIVLAAFVTGAIVFFDEIKLLFERVPEIVTNNDGTLTFNDNTRFEYYGRGIEAFKSQPIFGISFYPDAYDIYDFANIDAFSSFFPPRWHNTVIQLLASAGIVGLAAYIIHRISTVVLFIKRRSSSNTFLAISIIALLLMSLVDNHFFNVGPVFLYSTMLAAMECAKRES